MGRTLPLLNSVRARRDHREAEETMTRDRLHQQLSDVLWIQSNRQARANVAIRTVLNAALDRLDRLAQRQRDPNLKEKLVPLGELADELRALMPDGG